MTALAKISSKEIKNRLRGLQNKQGGEVAKKTLNLIRKNLTLKDAGAVSDILYGSKLYSHLGIPEEFPKQPANFDNHYSLADMNLRLEVAGLRARQIANHERILSFLRTFAEISQRIIDRDFVAAMDLIEEAAIDYGYSIRLLLKVSYIYTRADKNAPLQIRSKKFLDYCGLSSRNFVARGAVDILSANYSFLFIRRNITQRENIRRKSNFRNNIGEWLFFPIQRTKMDLSKQLQSQRLSSLIDATFTLFENTLNIDYGHRFDLKYSDFIPSYELECAWNKLSNTSIPTNSNVWDPGEDGAFQFYRESISWLEVAKITKFRTRVDALYRDPESRKRFSDHFSQEQNRNFYLGLNSLSQLSAQTDRTAILEEHFSVNKEGTFGRTLAFLHLISSPLSSKKLNTSQLLSIMNSTRDIELLLDSSEFDLLLEEGEVDALFRVIILTLKSQHSGSPRAASRLRTAFESLLINDYQSNLLAFFESLARVAPQVSKYLFELCDERFLDLLHQVVPEGQSVLQVRADLLFWYAETFDEKSYSERARIMQIDDRIQRVRGTIDDTRIYADKLRFAYWIEDNFLDELLAIAREERPSNDAISMSISRPYEDTYTPQNRMAKLLQSVFQQFCENTHFGIASYLGRRIRHGTLAGVLTSKVEEIISAAKENEFENDPQACHFLEEWLKKYKTHVDELGSDYLQVYSQKNKPKGLIKTNIWGDQKLLVSIGVLRKLFETLNEDSINDVVNGLIQSCWQLVQHDLERIRRHFTKCRIVWGMLESSEFMTHAHSNRRSVTTFCARLNVSTDEVFKTVTSWFHQPQDMVPSAPLALLFDAVVKEVQEAFPMFTPDIHILGQSDITLTGGTYHIVYDALYILIGNAAKHGNSSVKIFRRFDFVFGSDSQRELLVSVKSSCTSAHLERIKIKMEEALTGDNSAANTFESGSGFKKLVHLRDYSRELHRIEYSIEGCFFSVDLFFELLA